MTAGHIYNIIYKSVKLGINLEASKSEYNFIRLYYSIYARRLACEILWFLA